MCLAPRGTHSCGALPKYNPRWPFRSSRVKGGWRASASFYCRLKKLQAVSVLHRALPLSFPFFGSASPPRGAACPRGVFSCALMPTIANKVVCWASSDHHPRDCRPESMRLSVSPLTVICVSVQQIPERRIGDKGKHVLPFNGSAFVATGHYELTVGRVVAPSVGCDLLGNECESLVSHLTTPFAQSGFASRLVPL